MKDFSQVEEKILVGLLITATVLVAQGFGNRCGNKGEIELYEEQNPTKYSCWPFPECLDGQEPTVEWGSTHPSGTDISCQSCQQNFFSNKGTNIKCRKCTSCGKKQELSPCSSVKDRVCSNRCISSDYYYNTTDKECHRCTKCCEGDDINIEPQCITITSGTVIGGKGQYHCRISSKPCNNLPKKNLPSKGCDCNCTAPSNCSLPKGSDTHINQSLSNNVSLTEKEMHNQNLSSASKQCGGRSFDALHITLVCFLGLCMVLIVFLVWLVRKIRKQSTPSEGSFPPESRGLSSLRHLTCTACACSPSALAERAPFLTDCTCMSCQEKLNVIPADTKLGDLPFQVENKLIKMLDAKKPLLPNWWHVGRVYETEDLDIIKREEDREGGSPTKSLLSCISIMEKVPSLKEFMQVIHSELGRHDICRAIAGFYQNQNSAS